MNHLICKVKKTVFIQIILSGVIVLSFIFTPLSYAQEPATKEEERVFVEENNQEAGKGAKETADQKEIQPNEGKVIEKKEEGIIDFDELKRHSNAYKVLGREFTTKEKAAFGTRLTYNQIINQFLYKEFHLVYIRAAITLGEAQDASEIAKRSQEVKPYDQILKDFADDKETYGSILKALEIQQNLNLTSDEIFKRTALIAYYKVFGEKEEDLTLKQKEWLFSFLKDNDASTLSAMVKALIESMTEEEKKDLLFKVLDEIKRPDLKKNKNFVDKLLKQQFTYENLKKLLEELKQ